MLFSSIEFLFLVLPLTLAVYYLLPFRWNLKNYWLLAASLFFYAWGEPRFVFAMLASIGFNYVMALAVGRRHFFGELAEREGMRCKREISFAGRRGRIAADAKAYLTRLYGPDYKMRRGLAPRSRARLRRGGYPMGLVWTERSALMRISSNPPPMAG